MKNKLFHSLPFRTGITIALSAAGLTIILSYAIFQKTVAQVVGDLSHRITQLIHTVENTAAIAAYLENKELALEVSRGLAGNDIVHGVLLRSASGMVVLSGEPFNLDDNNIQQYSLASPFMEGEQAGAILIKPNGKYIHQVAIENALGHVFTLAVQSLLITFLVIVLVNRLLTKPLKVVAETLHNIEPGSDFRLACPYKHENSEIGQLVQDTNKLLSAAQNTLEGERRLRGYVEALERKTRQEAERDPLTQLFNRRAGVRAIKKALEHALSESLKGAVMLIDLDGFKPINDTYGHEAGDRVLVEVAKRLVQSLRQSDIVIRWGGDEFLIVFVQAIERFDVTAVAEKVLNSFSAPIDIGNGLQGVVGASIGVAVFPEHGKDDVTLVDVADKAMYHVKRSGKNGFSIHGKS